MDTQDYKDKNRELKKKLETNEKLRSGESVDSTASDQDGGEVAHAPEEQTRTWKENEDSSMDREVKEDEKSAHWAEKDKHPGKRSGKADETAEEEEDWNAKDFGEGRGYRQPNTLDQQQDSKRD